MFTYPLAIRTGVCYTMNRLRDTGRDSAEDNKDKKGQKTMIGLMRENGVTVRLDASYDVEKETAVFTLTCKGFRIDFYDFKDAAQIYKSICADVKEGREVCFRLAQLQNIFPVADKEVA